MPLPRYEQRHTDDSRRDQARQSQSWAQQLKRVFSLEVEKSEKCGGKVRVVACIEDPDAIQKILMHLGLDEASQARNRSPPSGLFAHSTSLF